MNGADSNENNKGFLDSVKNKISTFKRSEFYQKLGDSFFRLIQQVKKEFRILRTDPMNLVIALVLPPLIITLFGFMMNQATSEIIPMKVIVVGNDSKTFVNENNFTATHYNNYTQPYLDAVEKSEQLELIEFYNTSEEIYAMEIARESLLNGTIECIIVIPAEFSELLIFGYPGLIECVPDSSDIKDIQNKLNAVHDSIKIFVEDNDLDPQFELKENKAFSIPEDYNFRFNYAATLMLSFIIFGISTVLTILVIVQEKPIARLLLTPVRRAEILLSKYITYTLILIAQIALVLTSSMLNGLYVAGSLADLFFALFIVGFTGISIGMFISSIAKTKTEANQLFFAFFILIVLLSGIFVPIESMPVYLQAVAYLLPLSHGEPMISGIVTKAKSVFGFHFFSLLGLSALFFTLSVIIFMRRRYEV